MVTFRRKAESIVLLAPLVLGAHATPVGDPPSAARPQVTRDALDELVAAIGRRAVEEDGVPGLTIAVARDGKVAVCRGFGYADAARGALATPDTLWPAGSFVHAWTAAAALRLVEAGKLSLDDDIAKLLPEFPAMQHELRLKHLLANTGGVPSWLALQEKHPDVARREMNEKEFLTLYADVPFAFEPGSAYSLDNSGYALLGMILARVSGESLAEHLKTHVIRPLGLTDTDVCPAESRPVGYAEDCKQILDDHDLAVPMRASPYAGDQALCSTAGDLALWMQSALGRNALGAATTQALTTPVRTTDGEPTGASFALTLGKLGDSAWYAHAGGVGGFRLRAAHYARVGVSVVVISNCASAQVDEFEHEIACHVLGLPSPNPREVALSAADIAKCVGAYQIATTRVSITEKEGKLGIEWPTGSPIALRHRGALAFDFVGEPDSKLVFRIEDGRAASFELTRSGLVTNGRRMD
ncbi:MAG: serine hydrolase [Planctomycetota bacterium]|nr:serine hydrolase [Planctomycetota bacterium]